MRHKNLKYTGLMLAGVIIIVSFVYAVNIQPVVVGDLNNFPSSFSGLKTFESYRELTEFLNNRQSGYPSYHWDLEPRMFIAMDDEFSSSDVMSAAKSNGGMVVDYSQTNVQVTGVDEPDIVKTDGEYLYIVYQNKVIIVKATPAENATIECEIEVNSSLTIRNIFISGNRLVIFAEEYNYPIYKEPVLEPIVLDVDEVSKSVAEIGLAHPRWYSSPDTHLEIYDLSDLENPELVRDVMVPGHFSGARMIDDFVYLITTQNQYEILYLDDNETIVPRILVNGEVQVVELDDISYVDIPEETSTITNIVSVNVHDDEDEVNSKMFLLGYTQVLYVSRDNIYVAYSTSYYDYDMLQSVIEEVIIPVLPDDVKQEIELVETLKNLNEYQKKTVTEWILQNFTNSLSEDEQIELYGEINRRLERTTIHRISINDGEIEYMAQGDIPGRVSDQFQLSEHDGHLRISSIIEGNMVRSFFSNMQTMNNIYVLNMDLELVGRLEGLAPDERIYATRFLGDTCYLVTFRQIDPFFVIDLSNPEKPKLLGELKIPGYSTYLHPYDDDHVIGIGMQDRKVKISLFDVSNMSNPIELSKYEITNDEYWGWGESFAMYEHKAFLFDKDKNLLVIPAGTYNKQSAYIFDINIEDGIELKGTVTHENPGEDEEDDEEYYYWYSWNYGYSIKRTLYIEDVLYTLSDNMLMMHNLEDLSEINSIHFS